MLGTMNIEHGASLLQLHGLLRELCRSEGWVISVKK